MKDRIRQIMESMHMSQQVFAQFIDLSPASLSSVFNGRTKPTLNIVEAIKNKIPAISTDWLMFGKGEMYDSPSPNEEGLSRGDNENTVQEQTLDFGSGDKVVISPTLKVRPVERTTMNKSYTDNQRKATGEEKRVERPQRSVVEIRVYYDDLTYESFVPAKKS